MRRFLIALALLLPQAAPVLSAQDTAPVQATAEDFLRAKTRNLPGEVVITVEPPTNRNKLAPCQAFEAFQPTGARAWGRTTVGVRCVAGAHWSLYLQARVKVVADYLVAAHPLVPGQALRREDLASRNGDLTQLPEGTLTDPEQALGRLTSSNIAQGQPLRADQLRQPPVVQQGQNVTVVSRGENFQVSTEGVAMGNAAAGQVVQVRLSSGQVRSGIARPGGVVEMSY